ncbi:hypothetical protein EYF80_012526 [Liparis tanakae]|uniref:Uncharacterized protein n=1 Tax=Liparis tanakae TaxID=230148 RepID=A0A4Z2IGR2_9TELE|nr:hypothetical protein EYF80_012526 [Liparis tanakae]
MKRYISVVKVASHLEHVHGPVLVRPPDLLLADESGVLSHQRVHPAVDLEGHPGAPAGKHRGELDQRGRRRRRRRRRKRAGTNLQVVHDDGIRNGVGGEELRHGAHGGARDPQVHGEVVCKAQESYPHPVKSFSAWAAATSASSSQRPLMSSECLSVRTNLPSQNRPSTEPSLYRTCPHRTVPLQNRPSSSGPSGG